MELLVTQANPAKIICDALALLWTEGKQSGMAKELDAAVDGFLTQAAADEAFKGKAGECLVIRTEGKLAAKRVVLVGCGPLKEQTEETARVAGAAAWNAVKKTGGKLVIALDTPKDVATAETAKAATEGVLLAGYRYGQFKTLENEGPSTVVLLVSDAKALKQAKEGYARGKLFAEATKAARELVNHPGGHLTPAELAKQAEALVSGKPRISFTSYDKAKLVEMGMGGLLGVGQGSDHDPVLVHMVYSPAKAKKRVALVGKAITFDSGGLSIKSSKGMETMKCDMAGAAAVIGAMSAVSALKPDVEVHGIFGACENMVSGNSLRPGDVVKTMSGKTIEILNTDAEGRVTLADTLHFATTLEPDYLIDLATLTGAVVVALGEEITGLMSNDPRLAAKVKAASMEAGEKMWELPLEPNYKFELKSDVADYKNDTSRNGMSITAGLLLQEFVGGTPWVHLDIAGPAFADRPHNAYTKKGGTGHAVRTLLTFINNL